MEIKVCKQCIIPKKLDQFYKDTLYCKQCKKYLSKIYYENNKEWKKEYYQKNKKKINSQSKIYYKNNKEFRKKYDKFYYENNKIREGKRHKIYFKHKYNNDINFKILHQIRRRLNNVIKYNKSLELLGCSIKDYKQYLESQFKPEMNWDNHGKIWEIDHIKGCLNFNLTNIEEQQECFHYTNTQPLFKTTKIAKSFGYINEIGNRNKNKKNAERKT